MTGVKDSHRTLTELVGAARDAFGDELTAREQAGLVRFEQAVARRTLRGTARARRVGVRIRRRRRRRGGRPASCSSAPTRR